MSDVTRLEVIGNSGRLLVMYNLQDVELSYQDGNRTLKIFAVEEESENELRTV